MSYLLEAWLSGRKQHTANVLNSKGFRRFESCRLRMFQNKTFVLIFCILVLVVGGILYLIYPTPQKYGSPNATSTQPVACTLEAKMCPDGSYVGRQGPNCEFAPCPIPPGTQMEDGTVSATTSAQLQ